MGRTGKCMLKIEGNGNIYKIRKRRNNHGNKRKRVFGIKNAGTDITKSGGFNECAKEKNKPERCS